MSDQIYIGDDFQGLKNNVIASKIDNNAFATMFNMYAWRSRIKRKPGTATLGRFQVQVQVVASGALAWQYTQIALVAGAANLITGFSLGANSSIVPGSISLTVGSNTYTEPAIANGTLVGTPSGSGTIIYSTGAITITGGGTSTITGTFSYYPNLPVLGLEDYVSNFSSIQYPLLLSFDTTNAYQLNQSTTPGTFYNVSYYKNTNNPLKWSNNDYAQFWSTNYQSAFWVTNNKPGLHFVNAMYSSNSGSTTITFNFKSNSTNFTTLVVGDILWFNQWPSGSTINGLNGTISNISGAASGNYVVTFASSQTVSGSAIAILLTNSISGQDGIRWYDGDPTGGTGLPTATGQGWVNFSPPLTAISTSINDQQPALYYLVGALAILPFKDRLLFFAPQIQALTNGVAGPVLQRPLQDMVLWSWNGTPYYNSLVPTSPTNMETYDPTAYYVDQTGKGGYLPAGISQPLTTIMNNEDVILIGFGGGGKKTRFVYTGNDLQPFLFYLINSELPSSATFSGVTLDRGGIDIGEYGLALTTQQSSQRVDLDIPYEIFKIQALNNGLMRVNAVRDFYNEWIYFTYPTGTGNSGSQSWKYPNLTLLFNYRDNTWAIFRENFTHHGSYRQANYRTWKTLPFKTWANWREPWNAGSSVALFPSVVAGNPQGFVLIKESGSTGEAPSGTISNITNDGFGFTKITSINHCVNSQSSIQGIGGDYLQFLNAIGTTTINSQIGLVTRIIDINNFVVDIAFDGNTYLGLGTYTRLSQPLLQTKQFDVYAEQGRKVRLGIQQYLLDKTANSQLTVNINLSQDSVTPYNQGPIVPNIESTNNALIYSQVLFTCPESTNLGLTPANVNLQMPTASSQAQIWHRMNTSLIGDSVQIGLTLNDAQMRNITYATSEIALHKMRLAVSPSQLLS